MKRYSEPQRIISILMIFIMMIHFSGCVSSKILSKSDLPVSGSYPYKIQSRNTNFLLPDVEISSGKLSGKVESAGSVRYTNVVNIYLTSDSVIKIDEEKILSLPLDSITKVKLVKPSAGKTLLLIAGITAFLVVIALNSDFMGFNFFPDGI